MAKQPEQNQRIDLHLFVKYGSSAIDLRIGKLEDEFGIEYIHSHNGNVPTEENRSENYNRNMKIKAGVLYKFNGLDSQFNKLCRTHNNLEIITDKN